jgi:hypothetical protein
MPSYSSSSIPSKSLSSLGSNLSFLGLDSITLHLLHFNALVILANFLTTANSVGNANLAHKRLDFSDFHQDLGTLVLLILLNKRLDILYLAKNQIIVFLGRSLECFKGRQDL